MPFFMLLHGPGLFMIHNRADVYFNDVEKAAEACRELRGRSAIAEHQAWTSVDLVRLHDHTPEKEQEAYRMIGRFLAELADESQCLAVFEPGSGALHPFDPETEAKLRSDDPIAALREWYYAPIVRLKEEAIAAAVEEARRRWPEFVTAFENRGDAETPFVVKAPFGEGDHVEFMWVEVTALEGEMILGKLENHPHAVPGLKLGDRVRVKVGNVNDWLCVVEGQPLGGFTMAAMKDAARGDNEDE
jgi:uncharacterized protein YegJ (DUF2314 family)